MPTVSTMKPTRSKGRTEPMQAEDFRGGELFYSLRSPFARRVRLAFLESGCPFEEKVCDVFKPTAELLAVNPLGRVPVLRLKSGPILIDSTLILQAFYQAFETPLRPRTDSDQLEIFHWAALSIGLYD